MTGERDFCFSNINKHGGEPTNIVFRFLFGLAHRQHLGESFQLFPIQCDQFRPKPQRDRGVDRVTAARAAASNQNEIPQARKLVREIFDLPLVMERC
jgi:hypothetical protein